MISRTKDQDLKNQGSGSQGPRIRILRTKDHDLKDQGSGSEGPRIKILRTKDQDLKDQGSGSFRTKDQSVLQLSRHFLLRLPSTAGRLLEWGGLQDSPLDVGKVQGGAASSGQD